MPIGSRRCNVCEKAGADADVGDDPLVAIYRHALLKVRSVTLPFVSSMLTLMGLVDGDGEE